MTDFLISDESITQILEKSGMATARPYSWIKIGNSEISSKKLVFLLFDNKELIPVCVVKIGRSQTDNNRMEGEFAYQSSLWNAVPLRPNIARPIAFIPSDISPVLIEQWLPGTTLLREYYLGYHTGLDDVRQDIREIFSQIYFPFINATIDRSFTIDRKVEFLKLLDQAKNECPGLIVSQDFETQLLKVLNTSTSWSCPPTGRHGDFWLGNILLHQGKYHLIDWDTYQNISDPCFDFYHFWVTFALNYPGNNGSATDKFIQCFLKNSWFIELFRNSSREISTNLQISPSTAMISMAGFLFENLLHKKGLAKSNEEDYKTWLDIALTFSNHFNEFIELYSNLEAESD